MNSPPQNLQNNNILFIKRNLAESHIKNTFKKIFLILSLTIGGSQFINANPISKIIKETGTAEANGEDLSGALRGIAITDSIKAFVVTGIKGSIFGGVVGGIVDQKNLQSILSDVSVGLVIEYSSLKVIGVGTLIIPTALGETGCLRVNNYREPECLNVKFIVDEAFKVLNQISQGDYRKYPFSVNKPKFYNTNEIIDYINTIITYIELTKNKLNYSIEKLKNYKKRAIKEYNKNYKLYSENFKRNPKSDTTRYFFNNYNRDKKYINMYNKKIEELNEIIIGLSNLYFSNLKERIYNITNMTNNELYELLVKSGKIIPKARKIRNNPHKIPIKY